MGLSSLLTTTMSKMKEVIESLMEPGMRNQAKVIVGGATITATFANAIKADGYAPDAASAAEKVRKLIGLEDQISWNVWGLVNEGSNRFG